MKLLPCRNHSAQFKTCKTRKHLGHNYWWNKFSTAGLKFISSLRIILLCDADWSIIVGRCPSIIYNCSQVRHELLGVISALCREYFEGQKKGQVIEMTEQEIFDFTAQGLCPHPVMCETKLSCAFCTVKKQGGRRLIEFSTCDSIRDHFSILLHMVAD